MARQFQRGHKAKISDLTAGVDLYVGVQIGGPGLSFDISCFGLDADEKLSDDRYFVFFNQTASPEGSIQLLGEQAGDTQSFRVTLDRIPPAIHKLAFTATIDGDGTMSQVGPGYIRLVAGGEEVARYSFSGAEFSTERAVMLADVYRKDVWRFAAVGQGFDGGLRALLENFGGEVLEEEPAPAPAPQAPTPSFAPPAAAAAPPAFGAPAAPTPPPAPTPPAFAAPAAAAPPVPPPAPAPAPVPQQPAQPQGDFHLPPPQPPAQPQQFVPQGFGAPAPPAPPAPQPPAGYPPAPAPGAPGPGFGAPPQPFGDPYGQQPPQAPAAPGGYGYPGPGQPAPAPGYPGAPAPGMPAPGMAAPGAAPYGAPQQAAAGAPTPPGAEAGLAKYREVAATGRWTQQNAKLIKVTLAGTAVIAQQGSMVAYQGKVEFAHKGSGGWRNRLATSASGQDMDLMRCSGEGEVFLAEDAADLHIVDLQGQSLCVNAAAVLAFDEALQYEVRRIDGHGIPGGSLFTLQFSGQGAVILRTKGTPVVLPVTPTTFADSNAIVAWTAGAQVVVSTSVRLRRDAYPGHSGEAVNLQFRGAPGNFIVVQPYEV
ncbi:TerD family protein [Allostreptomyces psammosilenae]|uniref:Stress response protein SCP2/uncharacterized protein (AIM24 family) n=1 Tax=Allostreptomyces psammosilenae TaxID=1892865 RepID=A0A852ZX36_9ACTN|nr:TerD family protein [Allostreptomyces psammosilenae]NYI06267.1 stress response protein SCP2/uncharacterized protein (AIM24 family) [Allostreptomyces psammosilenae]